MYIDPEVHVTKVFTKEIANHWIRYKLNQVTYWPFIACGINSHIESDVEDNANNMTEESFYEDRRWYNGVLHKLQGEDILRREQDKMRQEEDQIMQTEDIQRNEENNIREVEARQSYFEWRQTEMRKEKYNI